MRSARWLSALVATVVLGGLLLAFAVPATGHSGDAIDSTYSLAPPQINGVMGAGEWAQATRVDLGAIPGNAVPAYLLVMNNDTWLWFAYDAVGDVTQDSNDTASFALDTGHDAAATNAREDQFVLGGWVNGGSGHFLYDAGSGSWVLHDAPFDPGLPGHAGLAGAWGFGLSDLGNTSHRIYEFQIPFALIGASAGDTVGLFGGSQPAPGVFDIAQGYSTWPQFVGGPIPLSEYGDLNLAAFPGPVGVTISPANAQRFGMPGTSVNYTLTVRNTGTAGPDVFDITATSVWSLTLWDAAGTVALPDTDGDTTPDTGAVPSGAAVDIVARVSIPPTATGCGNAVVNATSSANTSIFDSAFLTTCTAAAAFAPPHSDYGVDTDGPPNGLYDWLAVDVRLSVTQSDFYSVIGTLWSGDGSVFIDQSGAQQFLGPGGAVLSLSFPGDRIVSVALNGPYLVNLELYDGIFRQIGQDTHRTQPYLVTDFDPPPALFSPPHSDRGVDTDVPPNGRYDALEVNVSLAIDQAAFYYVDAPVFDQFGGIITARSDFRFWTTGPQVLTLAYDGLAFYFAGVNGPYTVELRLYNDFGSLLDADTHRTQPYSFTDFDPPPIQFSPPHSDAGVDADVPPDGLYDWLVVSASLEVNEPGAYIVQGYLYGPGGFPFLGQAAATANLTVGLTTVNLSYSGPFIQRSGVSGNYEVFLLVYGFGTNASDYDTHITNFYDFRQFQPPAGQFGAPHSDFGIDTSDPPDGLYDWLEIDATVEVTKASRFEVEAYVFDATLEVLAIADGSATLPVGRGFVPIRIDGHTLHGAADGSFFAYLFLYDANGLEIDDDTYFTRSYAGADFQPTDLAAPSSTASVTGYRKNASPIRVDFAATDPTPSDGLASVSLWYRYSANGATWFPWAWYETKTTATAGDAQVSGTFLFDLPAGEGYYEFYTVAADYGGNAEGAPAAADAQVAAFIPARLLLNPGTIQLTAGGTLSVNVQVVNADGQPVLLEEARTTSLATTSAFGVFRAPGTTTEILDVTIPAGASEASFDYYDTRAFPTTRLTAVATGVAPGTASVSVNPGAAASVGIAPTDVAVTVGGSVTFAAFVWDAWGNPVPNAPIAWAVSGDIGAITSAGVFSAATTVASGAVTVESAGLTATANVALRPGPVARLEALAGAETLTVGESTMLFVGAFDQYGNPVPGVAFAWSVTGPADPSATTGGAVIVTATGAGDITVSVASGAISDSVAITARALPPPPGGLAAPANAGIAGAIGGILAGFVVGWLVSRRRKKEELGAPPEEPK